MHEYLVNHALENVWCSPTQDNQLVFAPKRVTPARGALNYATVLGDTLELPVKKKPVHLFQIGQIDPFTIGLLRQVPHWRTQKWFKFSDAVNHANLEVTIYGANGVNLPRTDCYYIFLDERALIFAVPDQKLVPVNLEQEQIYFRFYTNVFYQRSSPEARALSCGAFIPTTNNDILTMEGILNQKATLPGHLRTYVNGLLVKRAVLGDVQLGDRVEWVHDSSIKKIVEWKLEDLHQFRSDLDNSFKYLLHYQGQDSGTIDFQDDIDVHVILRRPGKFDRGVYYNRNQESFHRMVTHRDYSIVTENVVSLRDNLSSKLGDVIPPPDQVIVQVMIREAGFIRPLVFENQRIFELYKLNEENRKRALIGLDANVPEWNCVELEKSAYNEVMRIPRSQVNIAKEEQAYGYNACSVILANTPTKTVANSGNQIANIPYGLQKGSTIYEFDAQGHLLGYHPHANDNEYEARDPACRLVEGVLGLPDETTDSVYGQTNIPMPVTGNSHRVYRCYLVGGVPTNNWEDITDGPDYVVVNGMLQWTAGGDDHWLMVRGDGKILAYDYVHRFNDGLFNFTIMENPTGNPVDDMEPLTVPLAQLDIWLNDHKLIENLDCYIKFPQVYVTNKTFLLQPIADVDQHLHIRMVGLPEKSMALDKIEDTGWILNRTLSNNNRFDLRDDKVLQINVGGGIMHRNDLFFAEDRYPSVLLDQMNGLPYQIKDIIVPMRGFTQDDTYVFRRKAQETDQRVSDYMTLKFGEMESTATSAITARYPVVSPFFSHIIHLLIQGSIYPPQDRMMTTMEVVDICRVHEGLLQWDPLFEANTPDDRFAYIVPHANETPYSLDFLSYRFLKQVVEIYGNGMIEISDYINITKE